MSTEIRPVTGLRYLILDFNAYFASVEQQVEPKYRGKPIAVVPMAGTDSTCAIAASYEAKRLGVKNGMYIREAKKLCPGLVLVHARHDLYVEYHEKLMREAENYLPKLRTMSIDEASFRLIGDECIPENARKIAQAMKDGIRRNVGECFSCSIGIAPTQLLAKIASNLQKPDGLTVLLPEDLPGPLLKLKLTDLPGISYAMERRLFAAGIKDMAAYWAITPKHAHLIWGSVGGERYWYQLHGVDIPDRPENPRRSISHSRILSPDSRNATGARIVARALLLKAAARMRRYGFATGSLGLALRSRHRPSLWKDIQMSPTQDSFALLHEMDRLWRELLRQHDGTPFIQASVWLSRLVPVDMRTPDLFIQRRPDGFTRGEMLWRALDRLVARYGRDTVIPASQRSVSLQYLGAKIAFTRVPEQAEFMD